MTHTNGTADPDIAARPRPLDVAAIRAWTAKQMRTRSAYEGVKARAAVPAAKKRRRR